MVAGTTKRVTKKQQNKKAQQVIEEPKTEEPKVEEKKEVVEIKPEVVEDKKPETKKKTTTKQVTKKPKEVKKKTTPMVKKEKKQKDKQVDKQEDKPKEEVGETKQGDKKRKFNIYYNGSLIEGACVTGLRPKQAAMKALSVIINNFFKDQKSKVVDKSAIGKELKFYLEESEGYGKNKTFKRFFYKGQKNYIVTKDTKDDYQKKMKKPVEFIEDDDGVIGIVAKHVTVGGEEKKIIHKYVNTVFMDREAAKEYREQKKEEAKKKKTENVQ